MTPATAPQLIRNARLPRSLLPHDWPTQGHSSQPALANIHMQQGRIHAVVPSATDALPAPHGLQWDVSGTLVLPGMVDAHTHLDKAFTLARIDHVEPGLLGAIDAMMLDKQRWTPSDIRQRAAQGLGWAYEAGVSHLRTHCDWWDPSQLPMAWDVLAELSHSWRDRLVVEQAALIPLDLFTDRTQALRLASMVAATGPHALLGGFVHSTNWSLPALRHLLQAAQHYGLDVDLHVDEELHAPAQGLLATAQLLQEMQFAGRVVCGHTCALAAKPYDEAQAVLDAVAQAPITLVTLPITNLLLQDATTGRTPRQRGLTLVKEARARGIPLLVSSDNVQDPFCPLGSFDPLEAFGTGVAAAQLTHAFDDWSDSVCRSDWLRSQPMPAPLQVGNAADLVLLPHSNAVAFPSRTQPRVVLRSGALTHGHALPAWAHHHPQHHQPLAAPAL